MDAPTYGCVRGWRTGIYVIHIALRFRSKLDLYPWPPRLPADLGVC